MAISTINDKLALISLLKPWEVPLPISSDGLDQADKQHLIWGYPGILWSELVVIDAVIAYAFTRSKTIVDFTRSKTIVDFTR